MSDRLMIAAMAMQGLLGQTENARCEYDAVAKFAVTHADALLAAAGEKEPVSIVDQPVSRVEYDRQVARAEAAESNLAACERERDTLNAELIESIDARDTTAKFSAAQNEAIGRLKRRLEPLTEDEAFDVAKAWRLSAATIHGIASLIDSTRARRA